MLFLLLQQKNFLKKIALPAILLASTSTEGRQESYTIRKHKEIWAYFLVWVRLLFHF